MDNLWISRGLRPTDRLASLAHACRPIEISLTHFGAETTYLEISLMNLGEKKKKKKKARIDRAKGVLYTIRSRYINSGLAINFLSNFINIVK